MTTGQPIKVPSDRNKYDNEFMENLRLQIKLNDANLQANRLYTSTGQLPASTQMADTRTVAEKLADVEGLKRSIVADLSPIAETSFAFAIIEGVINSPLNVDNSLFRYLAQNAPQIGQQLSKKYKFGIAGNANDVAIIVEFLEDAYNKTRNTFQTIKGYMNSSTNLRNNNTNLQDQIISEFKFFLQRLYQIEDFVRNKYGNVFNELFEKGRQLISDILLNLPNQQQMNQILSDMALHSQEQIHNLPRVARNQVEREYLDSHNRLWAETGKFTYDENTIKNVIDMLAKLPNPDTVRTLLNNLEKGFKLGDINIVEQTLISIDRLFHDWIESDQRDPTPFQRTLRDFRGRFLSEANQEIAQRNELNRISTIQQIKDQKEANRRDVNAQRVYVINPNSDPIPTIQGIPTRKDIKTGLDPKDPNKAEHDEYINQARKNDYDNYAESDYDYGSVTGSDYGFGTGGEGECAPGDVGCFEGLKSVLGLSSGEQKSNPKFEDVGKSSSMFSGKNPIKGVSNIMSGNKSREDYISRTLKGLDIPQLNELIDHLWHGSNLLEKQHLQREDIEKLIASPSLEAKKSIINAALISQSKDLYDPRQGKDINPIGINGLGLKKVKKGRGLVADYRDFGINKINHKKLNDGILTIRRKSNVNIPDMPSKRISRKLQKIITHISGGGVPDFNDINNLDDHEKDYLHKLISKSNLNDRLSVPAPSKDQEEKDFHQFEVMKGEILSGNDSKEMVKKFKALILKLSKQNVLPKTEVNELLSDLLSLGY